MAAAITDALDLDARADGYGVETEAPWLCITRADASQVRVRYSADGTYTVALDKNASGAVTGTFASEAAVRSNLGL